MEKKHYFLKLIPSRPSFSQDMTPAERAIMQQHIVYWRGLMDQGMVIVFGPVMDPAGVYGMGVIAVDDEDQVRTLINGDPANQINRYEYFPMRAIVKE